MKSACIGCIPLYERHTADYLKTSLLSAFEEFSIDISKITALVTNGEAELKKSAIDIVGVDKYIQCIAHAVSHSIPDALTVCDPELKLVALIDEIKGTVTAIRGSIPGCAKLKDLQMQAGKTVGEVLKLIQDVPTRFIHTVDMLERFVQLEQCVFGSLKETKTLLDISNREDMQILTEALHVMKLLEYNIYLRRKLLPML